MLSDPTFGLLVFGSLFAIVSPFATVPTFLALTDGDAAATRVSMAGRACVIATLVLILFSAFGSSILGALRVSIAALQIAGGLVILKVAFDMLRAERRYVTAEERSEGVAKEDVAITPLAVPVLCGPGTITTGIVLGSQAQTVVHYFLLLAAIPIVYGATFVFLWLAIRYSAALGDITMRIFTRLMGILLATIAAEFLIQGARAAFPS